MSNHPILKVLGLKQFVNEDVQFYANSISEHLKTSHLHVNKPHKHNFYATFLFTHGSGVHEIDFNSYEVKPNVVFVLSPGQTHNWELSADVEGIIFFHSKEFYEAHYLDSQLADYSFFSHIGNQAAIYLDECMAAELVPIFKKILSTNASMYQKKNQLLLSLITQVYLELDRCVTSGSPMVSADHDGYYSKFLAFQSLIEAHFREERSAASYANWMSITPKHLNRINKSVVNKTTTELIIDRLMLEAKRNLIYGKKNFAQVADELGFTEYAHFSKLFKNKTGQTPSEFVKTYG